MTKPVEPMISAQSLRETYDEIVKFFTDYYKKHLSGKKYKPGKDIVVEFSNYEDDKALSVCLYVDQRVTGKTYEQAVRNRKNWELDGRLEYESSMCQFAAQLYEPSILDDDWEETLEHLQEFAAEMGLAAVKAFPEWDAPAESGRIRHVWLGHKPLT